MPYTIRVAVPSDVEELVRLTLDMAWETERVRLDEDTMRRGMCTLFSRTPPLSTYYVAEFAEDTVTVTEAQQDYDASQLTSSGSSPSSPAANGGSHPRNEESAKSFTLADASCATRNENSASDGVRARPATRIAGFIMTAEEYHLRTGCTTQWVQTVYVAPSHRRVGLFRQLYDYVRADVLRKPHCTQIRLYVEEENASAKAAYEKLGLVVEPNVRLLRWSKCGF